MWSSHYSHNYGQAMFRHSYTRFQANIPYTNGEAGSDEFSPGLSTYRNQARPSEERLETYHRLGVLRRISVTSIIVSLSQAYLREFYFTESYGRYLARTAALEAKHLLLANPAVSSFFPHLSIQRILGSRVIFFTPCFEWITGHLTQCIIRGISR